MRRVELTHDVLCSVVLSSRDLRHEREARDEAERQLAAQQAREADDASHAGAHAHGRRGLRRADGRSPRASAVFGWVNHAPRARRRCRGAEVAPARRERTRRCREAGRVPDRGFLRRARADRPARYAWASSRIQPSLTTTGCRRARDAADTDLPRDGARRAKAAPCSAAMTSRPVPGVSRSARACSKSCSPAATPAKRSPTASRCRCLSPMESGDRTGEPRRMPNDLQGGRSVATAGHGPNSSRQVRSRMPTP